MWVMLGKTSRRKSYNVFSRPRSVWTVGVGSLTSNFALSLTLPTCTLSQLLNTKNAGTHERIENFKTRNNETVRRLIRVRREANEASKRAKQMLKVLDAINSVPSDAELEFQREIKKMSSETSQRLAPRVNLLKTQSKLVRDALKARTDEENDSKSISADQREFCNDTLEEMKEMLGSIRGLLK